MLREVNCHVNMVFSPASLLHALASAPPLQDIYFDLLCRPYLKVADAHGLVESAPLLDTVTKGAKSHVSEVHEVIYDFGADKALVAVLQALWQVPVVQGNNGLDSIIQELIDYVVVEIQALLVHGAALTAFRNEPGPADRQAEVFCAKALHESNVFLVAVVKVGRDVAGALVVDATAGLCEDIPYAGGPTIKVGSSFDL